MITMDYIVQPNSNLRENFYEYLIANHYEALYFKKEEFVSLPYPFVNVNLFLDKNVNFKFGHFDSFYTIIFCYFLTVQFYLLFYMNYLLY